MTFEEALNEIDIIYGGKRNVEYAIELMKADAMQKQADAIYDLKNLISDCMTKTTFSGAKVFTIRIDDKNNT